MLTINTELDDSITEYEIFQRKQSDEIERLSVDVEKIQLDIENLQGKRAAWLDNGYNYLAIGNSITSHPLADYWWNENVGMAASSEDKDYVHIINGWLSNCVKEKVLVQSYNFNIWEVQAKDRSETLSLLDTYLSEK